MKLRKEEEFDTGNRVKIQELAYKSWKLTIKIRSIPRYLIQPPIPSERKISGCISIFAFLIYAQLRVNEWGKLVIN
jgi:hypothetical protein